ncbi:DUF803-domain-containing protein [Ceratobasidium sp. AG-I]|nr:DUF803-domain-containing protein [Ceratobasidium sp. AG-I]
MVEDKWIGLGLACSSSLAIGTSFIITKKGLNDAARRGPASQSASDNLAYLKNPIWWAGIITLIVGEIANFAAYTFAPAILVTPLGALSVLIGAILASLLLNEELGHIGRVGCALCLLGSVIIVLHAPEDKEVQTVDEILQYALQPGFLFYVFLVLLWALFAIYRLVPAYGKKTPLVYISICSLVGSVSVMAIKGFGVAVKLTVAGNNQLTHPSTWVFGIVVISCIMVQMNYFNKALDTFSTNVVNPMYYVGFSTATILASALLFRGFNTTDPTNTVSLLAGFIVTFLGVHLLNASRHAQAQVAHPGLPDEEDVAWANPPASAGVGGHARRSSSLFRFDADLPGRRDEGVPLAEVREESDEEGDERTRLHRGGDRGNRVGNRERDGTLRL